MYMYSRNIYIYIYIYAIIYYIVGAFIYWFIFKDNVMIVYHRILMCIDSSYFIIKNTAL